jgi:hypothetical protein
MKTISRVSLLCLVAIGLSLLMFGVLMQENAVAAAGATGSAPERRLFDESGGSLPVTITLTISKVVVGGTPVGDWEFNGTPDLGDFTIPAGGGVGVLTANALTNYTITEIVKPGYFLSVDCDAAEWNEVENGVFIPGALHDVGCTFTNTQYANVTVVKKAIPQSQQTFDFYTSNKDVFTLIDDGTGLTNTAVLTRVRPGEFSVVEHFQPGWHTISRCDYEDGGASPIGDNNVDLTLTPGASALCVFTNTMNTITVIKQASPESAQLFDFHWIGLPQPTASSGSTVVPTPEGVFQLRDDGSGVGQSYVITQAFAGYSYVVSEDLPPGWKLDSLACVDNTGASVGEAFPENGYIEFDIASGQQYTCTFGNIGPSIALTKTVGVNPNECASSNTIGVLAGTTVYYCYTVQNTGPITFTTHSLEDSVLGNILSNFAYVLAPGASAVVTQAYTADVSVTNVATWTASFQVEPAGVAPPQVAAATTASATVTVTPRTPNIELRKTVGLTPAGCATDKQVSVFSGTKVYYCFTVENTGLVTLTKHSLQDSVLGQVLSNFDYVLAPGASVFITSVHTATVGVTNIATWTASIGPGESALSVVASDSATVTVTPKQPSLALRKTVGVDAAVCSTYSDIIVLSGTTVYYCYTVTNTGNITLPLHTLIDDKLGNLLVGFPYNLGPGQSVSSVAAGAVISAVITANTTNVGVWTAGVPGGGSVSATSSATVRVGKASISVIKTVSKNAVGCGVVTTLNVLAGEQVYFCVTVQNTGDFTFTYHMIDDPLLNFKTAIPYVLKPGEVVVITRDIAPQLGPITINAPITNAVTFTSSTHMPNLAELEAAAAQPVIAVASSTGVAFVKVQEPTALEETPEPSADLPRRLYLPVINR